MLLPNFDEAIIEIEKLRDYCLNPEHPRGKHKARVFQSVLGLNETDAEMLCEFILHSLSSSHAIERDHDEYGKRFSVDIPYSKSSREVVIRTLWIIRREEKNPRLTSCYIM